MSSLAFEELDTQHVDPPEFVAGDIDVAEVGTLDTPDLQHSDLRSRNRRRISCAHLPRPAHRHERSSN
jgi:hypothetical protein